MTIRRHVADIELTEVAFAHYFRAVLAKNSGHVRISFVLDRGTTGYQIVVSNGLIYDEERINLLEGGSSDFPNPAAQSIRAREIVETELTESGFAPEITTVVDLMLNGDGSVMIVVEYGQVVRAHHHKGLFRP